MTSTNPQFWLREVLVKVNILTLMAVHNNLLLALRHPQNLGEPRDLVLKFAKEIGEELVLLGAIAPEQLQEMYMIEAKEKDMPVARESITHT